MDGLVYCALWSVHTLQSAMNCEHPFLHGSPHDNFKVSYISRFIKIVVPSHYLFFAAFEEEKKAIKMLILNMFLLSVFFLDQRRIKRDQESKAKRK